MLAQCPCGKCKVIPPYRVSTRTLWYCCQEHRAKYPKPLLPGEDPSIATTSHAAKGSSTRNQKDPPKRTAIRSGTRIISIQAALLLCRVSRR